MCFSMIPNIYIYTYMYIGFDHAIIGDASEYGNVIYVYIYVHK
jgi:hypothetical protein